MLQKFNNTSDMLHYLECNCGKDDVLKELVNEALGGRKKTNDETIENQKKTKKTRKPRLNNKN